MAAQAFVRERAAREGRGRCTKGKDIHASRALSGEDDGGEEDVGAAEDDWQRRGRGRGRGLSATHGADEEGNRESSECGGAPWREVVVASLLRSSRARRPGSGSKPPRGEASQASGSPERARGAPGSRLNS